MPTIALLSWIVIAPLLATRLTAVQIVIWLTLVPYLFLPEKFAINLPGLPDIDKTASISLGLLGAYLFQSNKFRAARRFAQGQGAPAVKRALVALFALMFAGAFLSLFSNREPLVFEFVTLPGLRLWDSLATVAALVLLILPFVFASRFLSTSEAHKEFLAALVICGVVYSLLILVEARLSPQLHTWVYGYFQHSFVQHVRGGYRPIVFLQHGIWVGFFIFTSLIAAFALWRSTQDRRWLYAGLWLLFVLVLSRNLGALMIGLFCLSVFLLRTQQQIKIAAAIALVVLLYPALRQVGLIPTDQLTGLILRVSQDRAQSLQFRFDTEDLLLDRAALKPLTGWGGYSREQIYDERGKKLSTPDGLWILTIGTKGWVGYIALFGVLTFPILFVWSKRLKTKPPPETMALVLIITGNLIYLIPNATLTPVGWLTFGALAGHFRYGDRSPQSSSSMPTNSTGESVRELRYSRFPASRKQ